MRLFLLLFVVVDAAVIKRLRADPEEMVPSSQIHPLVCEHFAPYFGPEFTVLVRYLAESLGGFKPDLALAKIKEALPFSEYNLQRVDGVIVALSKFMGVTKLVYRLFSENAHRPITELVAIILARDAVDGASMRSESSAFVGLWIWRKYCLVVGMDCQYDGKRNIWRFRARAMRAFLGDVVSCPRNSSFDGVMALVSATKALSSISGFGVFSAPLATKRLRIDHGARPEVDSLVCQRYAPYLGPEFTVLARHFSEVSGGYNPEVALTKVKQAVPTSEYTLKKVNTIHVELLKVMVISSLVYRLFTENADKSIIDLVPIILERDALDGRAMRNQSSAFVHTWIWRKYCIEVGVDCQYDVKRNLWRFKTRAMRAFLGDVATCSRNSFLEAENSGQNVDDSRSFNTFLTSPAASPGQPRSGNAKISPVPFHKRTRELLAILNRDPRRQRVRTAALTMPAARPILASRSLAMPAASDPGLTVSLHSAQDLPLAVCQFLTFQSASKEANVAFQQYLLTSYFGRCDADICLEEMKRGDIDTTVTREEVEMMFKRFEDVNRISVGGYEQLQVFANRSEDEVLATMNLMGHDSERNDLYMSALYVWKKYCFGFEGRNCRLNAGGWTIDRPVMQEFIKSLDICII